MLSREINLSIGVLERRAEIAEQCECLAAWDDDRECICNKSVEVPLALDALEKAQKLALQLKDLDRRISQIEALPGEYARCEAKRDADLVGGIGIEGQPMMMHYSDGHSEYERRGGIPFRLPKRVAMAALRAERHSVLEKLSATGIVSVERANIRSTPQ